MSKELKRKFDAVLKVKIEELIPLVVLADFSLTDEVNWGQYNDLRKILQDFLIDEIGIEE